MAVTSARTMINLKEKGHFEKKNENQRIDKYTLGDELGARLSALQIHTMQPSAPAQRTGYTVRTLTADDRENVLHFLRRFFFRDEPMNKAVELLENPQSRCEELEQYATSSLEDGVSVAAVDDHGEFVGIVINGIARREVSTDSRHLTTELEQYATSSLEDGVSAAAVDDHGEFVGVVISGIARREVGTDSKQLTTELEQYAIRSLKDDDAKTVISMDADYTDKSENCPNPKFRRILKVLGHLDREAKIWDYLPSTCTKVVEVRIASTHDAWRGRGLMRVLCEETERLAKSVGASALRMDTTSAFSAAAAERLNYKQIYSIPYSQLEYAPQPPEPHLEARVYIKQI